MALWRASFLGGLFLLAAASAWGDSAGLRARADLIDTTGKAAGHATLVQEKEGVRISISVSGLTPGKHGFHIHETGNCTPPDFKSAGGHFNPFHKHHGSANPQGMHAGDLPNLEAAADGSASASFVAAGTTLGPGPGSLLKQGGSALVIHASPDDNMSDPAGNAGARVACGVIVAR